MSGDKVLIKKLLGLEQRIMQSALAGDEFGKVLMFHQINDKKEKWLYPNTSITERNFKRLIDFLTVTGHRFIEPSQMNIEKDNKSVLITIDDPFQDAIDNGAEYLIQKKIPFTIFVSKELVGLEPYLSEKDFENLIKEPLCTIGSHCLNHSVLRNMNAEDSMQEIMGSKTFLEDRTKKKVDCLAYPYGSLYAVGSREQQFAKQAGYHFAFSTLHAGLNKKSMKNSFFLPRYNINDLTYGRYINGI